MNPTDNRSKTTMAATDIRTSKPSHRDDLADVEGAVQIGACKVCGRPLYTTPGLRGGRPDYCRPGYVRERRDGRTVYVREERSKCAIIAKRTEELRRLSLELANELENDASAQPEQAVAAGQALKGYIWSELNAATNVFGRLVKKLRK